MRFSNFKLDINYDFRTDAKGDPENYFGFDEEGKSIKAKEEQSVKKAVGASTTFIRTGAKYNAQSLPLSSYRSSSNSTTSANDNLSTKNVNESKNDIDDQDFEFFLFKDRF